LSAHNLVVCSHRGPYVFDRSGESAVARRGGGGLIGAVAPLVERFGGTWIAAALKEGDREAAAELVPPRPFALELLDLPSDAHALHYDVVSNEYLWFLFHYLFDTPTAPLFDARFHDAWAAYRHVNELYADAVAACGPAAAVLVQDYHLMLVPALLRERRIRRPVVYFHHTPWCDPEYFGMLPETIRDQLLLGLLEADVVGFHARRWADAFLACCEHYVPRARVGRDVVERARRSTRIVVAPVPIDTAKLKAEAADERTEEWAQRHTEARAGRKLLLRVDRIDLSKNPLRGFLAFEQLLERSPALASEMLFLALLYPSRQSLESYRRYYAACTGVVRRINERHPQTEPVSLYFDDDYHRSLGAMRVYDALLVNPVFDGLNMVAKEGSIVNRSDGALILSRNAGVFEELGAASIAVNPFDVSATADAIDRALHMPAKERAAMSSRARRLGSASTPETWGRTQLEAAGVDL
jgi:trehalose 6-phosphate synthase